MIREGSHVCISFIYIINNTGPRTEPWGIPAVKISLWFQIRSLIFGVAIGQGRVREI